MSVDVNPRVSCAQTHNQAKIRNLHPLPWAYDYHAAGCPRYQSKTTGESTILTHLGA